MQRPHPADARAVALPQLGTSMNIMLVAVVVVSVLIGELSTGLIVALFIVVNIVLGTRQELESRATVDVRAKLQVPEAKVVVAPIRGMALDEVLVLGTAATDATHAGPAPGRPAV